MIDKIAIHHSGGFRTKYSASSKHLTFEDINLDHKKKWNFLSLYIPGQYGGYTFAYDPKIRKFHQYRAIGEETAAQKGFNLDTFSLCIIGNYNRGVDSMTEIIEKDVAEFISDLMDGNKRGLIVVPNTKLDFSVARIYAHRFFTPTDCYGTSLDNLWARSIVLKEKKVRLIRSLILIYSQMLDLLRKGQFRSRDNFGSSVGDRECSGIIG